MPFLQLCMVLIKVADISNEARPMEVAEPWLDRLLQVRYQYILISSALNLSFSCCFSDVTVSILAEIDGIVN